MKAKNQPEQQPSAAVFDPATAVKRMGGEVKRVADGVIGGYGVVFSQPVPGDTDLEYDVFTPDTEFFDDMPTSLVIYDHAMGLHPDQVVNGQITSSEVPPIRHVIGKVVKRLKDGFGIWFEAVLSEHDEWSDYVQELIAQGVLNWSTDSMSHLVRREQQPNGVNVIKSWPIPAISLTPKAAEPRATVAFVKHASPEAVPAERHADAQITPHNEEPTEKPTMAVKFSKVSRSKVVDLLLDEHWDELKGFDFAAAVKEFTDEEDAEKAEDGEEVETEETKQEGGEIVARLQPLADELVALAGGTAEEALALLMQAAMQLQQANLPAPDATDNMEVMEEEDQGGYMSKSTNPAEVRRLLRESVQRGGYQHKNVRFNRNDPAKQPRGLARMIKAITQKNWGAMKALGINPDTAGGYLVPVEQSTEIIELLRTRSLFMTGGDANRLVSFFPMASDTLTVPKLTGGASVSWIGENSAITDNSPTFGQITLVAKKMATLIKISNELLQDSDPSVDAIIREDMARAMANEADRVILRGSGQGNEPQGLANIADITKTALNAIPTYDNLVDCVSRVEEADVPLDDSWAWVFRPREKATFRKMEDTEGQKIWSGDGAYQRNAAGEVASDLIGYPWFQTTQINIDTVNNNETKIYFGRWRDVVVGMRKTLEIVASNEAGTSFEYDQTWIRAILRMDVNIRHAESIEILTDVRA